MDDYQPYKPHRRLLGIKRGRFRLGCLSAFRAHNGSHLGPDDISEKRTPWCTEAPESENLSIFTDLVLVRFPCLLGRSRPSIHRWKALVAKEKTKERKGGGREGVWVVFRHRKHGVYAVKTGAEQFMASAGAKPTREKEHIGENPTSHRKIKSADGPCSFFQR